MTAPVQPFPTVWASFGEAETQLLAEILDAAEAVHTALRRDRERGSPHPYAEHMALEVESRTRALLALSPHLIENFAPEKAR